MYYWIRYCKPGLDVCSIDTLLFSQRMRVLHAGNICRSPTAEAVFRAVVDKADRKEHFNIDSCGTGGGNPDWCAVYLVLLWAQWWLHLLPDVHAHANMPGTRRKAGPTTRAMSPTGACRPQQQSGGVCLTSLSRPLRPEDLRIFDYILGMVRVL